MGYLVVFVGAGIGGALRHATNLAAVRLFGYAFPYGTFIVNILGSFLMGLFAGYFAFRTGMNQHLRLFLTTGLLGGFTTFSTFSLDTALLMERNNFWAAAGYVAGSAGLAVFGLFLGMGHFRAHVHLP